MAASSKIGGYQCEFLGTVSEDFVCGICKHVAREPHLTGCCGMTVCKVCISPVSEDKKPCPSCEKAELAFWFNVRDNQRILALEVRCMMKDRGCEWTGKLEGLEAHLDVNTGDCEYVDVECPNKCEQPVEKRNLNTHLANCCPKREFTCQHCNFKATYEIVSNDHWPQCSFYPVPCPNACGIQAIERGDLEAHLSQCPLEEVECDFSHAGCNTKLPRQDMERHTEESTQKHLVLMSAKSVRLEQRLQEQQETFQHKLQEQQQEAAEKLQKVVEGLEEKLQKMTLENEAKTNEQLQQKAQQVERLERCMGAICSPIIKMDNFKQHKEKQDMWYSPPLYTHPGGYKFCIAVEANGWSWLVGSGTHVAVNLYAMKGELDNQLQWPVKCTITLQLRNQHRDQDHITKTVDFQWNKPASEIYSASVSYFSHSFVAHANLEYNREKQTEYLKNDCLLFQVTKVELK